VDVGPLGNDVTGGQKAALIGDRQPKYPRVRHPSRLLLFNLTTFQTVKKVLTTTKA
jgi:hypothetical protein